MLRRVIWEAIYGLRIDVEIEKKCKDWSRDTETLRLRDNHTCSWYERAKETWEKTDSKKQGPWQQAGWILVYFLWEPPAWETHVRHCGLLPILASTTASETANHIDCKWGWCPTSPPLFQETDLSPAHRQTAKSIEATFWYLWEQRKLVVINSTRDTYRVWSS